MREVAQPHPVVIAQTLAGIENETRRREIREARQAHDQMKPVFITWRVAVRNGLIVTLAFAVMAWVGYELATSAVDAILRAFGQ